MKQYQQNTWPINQLFIFIATLSIVFMAMKLSAGIIVPFFYKPDRMRNNGEPNQKYNQ